MPGESALRVGIVGADAAGRSALRARLEAGGVVVSGDVSDAQTFLALAAAERPDVCLIADAPPLDGLAATAAIAAGDALARVLLIGDDPPDDRMLDAMAAGARGYLSAAMAPSGLMPAILDVAGGRSAFPRSVEALLIDALRYRGPGAE